MFSATVSVFALIFSIASFAYVNYDRRVKLLLQPRKGVWCLLERATNGRETIFQGIVEIYNHSSRPNVIRGYRFWIANNGKHEDLESEMAEISERSEPAEAGNEVSKKLFNVTPLSVPAYTGVEARIYALIKGAHYLNGDCLPVTVEIEDIHGKRYATVVNASRTVRHTSGR